MAHSKIKFLVVTLIGCHASAGSYDYRPDLYLDGKALSVHVAAHVCGNSRSRSFAENQHQLLASYAFSGNQGGRFGTESGHYDSAKQLLKLINAGETPDNPTTRNYALKQKAFEDWILKQPDNSVTPLTMSLKAIELQSGNVLNGLQLAYCWISFECTRRFPESVPVEAA